MMQCTHYFRHEIELRLQYSCSRMYIDDSKSDQFQHMNAAWTGMRRDRYVPKRPKNDSPVCEWRRYANYVGLGGSCSGVPHPLAVKTCARRAESLLNVVDQLNMLSQHAGEPTVIYGGCVSEALPSIDQHPTLRALQA